MTCVNKYCIKDKTSLNLTVYQNHRNWEEDQNKITPNKWKVFITEAEIKQEKLHQNCLPEND
jgi:hypothetical protein